MSKEVPAEPAPVAPHPVPHSPASILPKPVLIICVVLIAIGALLLLSRDSRVKASTYNAISHCDAETFKPLGQDRTKKSVDDGLSELFGLVQFKANQSDVARYLTYCETEPQLALTIFRQAMADNNANARIVAAYSSFFLARSGVLEAADFELLRKCIDKAESADLRRVAQRALSDLTVLKRLDSKLKYEEVPANTPPQGADEPTRKIDTDKQTLDGKDVLYVRWSSPDLAAAWWTANGANGAWDAKLHRFVMP